MANAISLKKRQIIATATGVNNVVTELSLATSQIYRNMSVAVTVTAVVNEVNNSHN
jgi:hypothetical protein